MCQNLSPKVSKIVQRLIIIGWKIAFIYPAFFLRIILLENLTFVSDSVFTEKVFDSLADIQEQFTRTLVKIR